MKKIIIILIFIFLSGCDNSQSSTVTPSTPSPPNTSTNRPSTSASNQPRVESIVDQTPPVINLIGSRVIELYTGQAYMEQGVSVTDNIDQNPTYTITGYVNTNIAGTYNITYRAQDKAGNVSVMTRVIVVKDRFEIVRLDRSNYTRYLGVEIDTTLNARRTAYDTLVFKFNYNRGWDYDFRMTYVVRWVEETPTGQRFNRTDYVYINSFEKITGKRHRFIGNCVEINEVRLQSISGEVRIK